MDDTLCPSGAGHIKKNGFSVKVRFSELEGIPDQLQARICSLPDNHLDDIESKEDIGIAQQSKPGQATERNPALLLTVHGFKRPAKILPRPCFHLDEYQRVALAADKIDLAALASAEVAIENLEALPAEKTHRQLLAVRPEAQMTGFRRQKAAAPPAQMSGGESGKDRVHGVSGGAARFRNPYAG